MEIVYAVDVGSITEEKNNFAWARKEAGQDDIHSDTDIKKLIEIMTRDFKEGHKISLGFECPLFIPVQPVTKVTDFAESRQGEGARPWSAGAGPCSLTTGLVEYLWLFQQVYCLNEQGVTIKPTFDRNLFSKKGDYNLFLWEAFITGTIPHTEVAQQAIQAYERGGDTLIDLREGQKPFSLIAAALLWAGFDTQKMLSQKCVVYGYPY